MSNRIGTVLIEGRAEEKSTGASPLRLRTKNHDFGGFDQSGSRLALLEAHFADCVGRDDRGDVLAADRKRDLRDEAADADVRNATDELIAAADAAEARTAIRRLFPRRAAVEKAIDFLFGDPVVSAGGSNSANLPLVDPLFESRVADAQDLGCVARCEKLFVLSHGRRFAAKDCHFRLRL